MKIKSMIIGLIIGSITTGAVGIRTNTNIISEAEENRTVIEEQYTEQINELKQANKELTESNEELTEEVEVLGRINTGLTNDRETLQEELDKLREELDSIAVEEEEECEDTEESDDDMTEWGIYLNKWAPKGYRFIAENNNYHHANTQCNHINDNDRQTKIVPEDSVEVKNRLECRHCY